MLGRTFGAGTDRFDSRGHSVILSISTAAADVRILLIRIRVIGLSFFSSVSAMKAPLPSSTLSPNSRAADKGRESGLPHLCAFAVFC